MSDDGLKRLHVSPLSPELLNAILHPSVRSSATDISFHAIPTFPENNYGFFTLPTMEADKITKKLNGSILKGKKLKIQEARPKKLPSESASRVDTEKAVDAPSTTAKSSGKRKSSEDAVTGFELPASRKVKRGWTEEPAKDRKGRKEAKTDKGLDKKKRKSQRSQYTDRPECLFRTVPPPNKDALDEKQKKKRKHGKLPSEGVVVHEFKHTVPQPTFLKESESTSEMGMTSEYVDGVGWVDRSGNVKEPAISKPSKKRSVRQVQQSTEPQSKTMAPTIVAQESVPAVDSDETSSSGSSTESSSSDSSTEDDDEESVSSEASVNVSANSSDEQTPSPVSKEKERKSERDVEKQAPSTPEMGSTKEGKSDVHPLEALFKRPVVSSGGAPERPPDINTQFSFFGKEDDESSENNDDLSANALRHGGEPHTPFTKMDLQKRGLRSGAPTPDTAAINRTMAWPGDFDEEEEEEEQEDEEYDDADEDKEEVTVPKLALKSKSESKEESDFSKWFWENRGDNNRAWKRRRREAAKEKRQRDNRKRGLRGK
jgi:hypothetical protein